MTLLFSLGFVAIDIQTVPPVKAPTITMVERTSGSEAVVAFDPQSEGEFDITYYVANNGSSPDLVIANKIVKFLCYVAVRINENILGVRFLSRWTSVCMIPLLISAD